MYVANTGTMAWSTTPSCAGRERQALDENAGLGEPAGSIAAGRSPERGIGRPMTNQAPSRPLCRLPGRLVLPQLARSRAGRRTGPRDPVVRVAAARPAAVEASDGFAIVAMLV